MKDKQARALAALGISASYAGATYLASWLFGKPANLTVCLVVLAVLFALVLWVLDRLAAANPEDHDS